MRSNAIGRRGVAGAAALVCLLPLAGLAGPGTETASFLDIPVGGRAAALGGAYGALAADAYAPVWNPGGLGFVNGAQFSSMHLAYLDGISYEHVSLVDRIAPGHSLGASIQYYHTGAIAGMDANGNSLPFTAYYAAYTLAYGHAFNERFSLGTGVKLISAKIDSAAAQAWAADFGGLYKLNEQWALAGVLGNLGSKLNFGTQGNSLPAAMRLAASYQPRQKLIFAGEFDTGLADGFTWKQAHPSLRLGVEKLLLDSFCLRLGYKRNFSETPTYPTGLTAGLGLNFWGQSFDYAWVPFGDLGQAQYFSILIRFGSGGREEAMRTAPKQELLPGLLTTEK